MCGVSSASVLFTGSSFIDCFLVLVIPGLDDQAFVLRLSWKGQLLICCSKTQTQTEAPMERKHGLGVLVGMNLHP